MKKTKRKSRKQSSIGASFRSMPYFHKALLVMAFFIFLYYKYLFLLLCFIGMLPTIVLMFSKRKDADKVTVVGLFNFAGVVPYAINMLMVDGSYYAFTDIISSMFAWTVMYGSAAVGLIIYQELPNLFMIIIKNWNIVRLKQIDKQLEKIKEEWGEI